MKKGNGTPSVAIVAIVVLVLFLIFLLVAYGRGFFPFGPANITIKDGDKIIQKETIRETRTEKVVPVPVPTPSPPPNSTPNGSG